MLDPAPPARTTNLIGRDVELDLLAGHLASAATGRGGAVAVIGEPGIGKTALVAATATQASDSGAVVLWGRCSALGGQSAWGPVSQALGALLDTGMIDPSVAAGCGGGLVALLPDAVTGAGNLVAPVGADPETVAFSVARAAARLLRHACLKRRCVLVIDDVHDADLPSLRLLTRLAQEARTMALLILMTAREAELGAPGKLAEVAELSRDLSSLRIGPIDSAAGAALIRRVAPALSGHLADRVLGAAEGNPLFLVELAALLAARSSSPSEELPIPLGIKASIRSRLDRLPGDGRAFVDALAVLGGHAPIERAAQVAEVAVSSSAHALEVGIAVASGPDTARLSHGLVREVAYAQLPEPQRALLHRRAAALAARRAAAGDHDAAIEHVRHLAGAGDAPAAIDAAIEAARVAELRAADDEAVSILEVAAASAERAPVDDRHRAELAITLGRGLLRCGRGDEGIAACARATAIAGRIGDPELVGRAALARGSVFRFGHVDRGLVEALRDATTLRGDREDALQARLLARLAAAEQPCFDPMQPIARAYQAIGLARRLGDEQVLMAVLHDGMAACVDIEDPRARVGPNRELRDLARRHRASWYEMRALNRLVFDHIELGNFAEADVDIESLDVVARSFAHPRHQWRVAMLRAMRALSDGRWEAADRHVDEAVALGGDDPQQPAALLGHRFARLRAQQRSHESIQALNEMADVLSSIPDSESVMAAFYLPAHARAGDLASARRLLPIAQRGLAFDDVNFMAMFAEAAATVGDRDACALVEPMLSSRAHRFISGGPMFMYAGDPVERYLGLTAAQLGDRSRAIALLESAVARLRATKSLPLVAQAALDLARLLGEGTAGERDRAASLAGEAGELAERFDLVDLRERTQVAHPPRASATDNPGPHLPTSPGFALVREGEAWAITTGDRTFRLRDSRGLRILSRLIENAGTDLHALDLMDGPEAGPGAVDRGDAGEMLDARARAEYRGRLVDLRDDLAEAERRGDLGWIDRLRTESDAIQAELSRAFGPGGRSRRSGAAAERARSAVTRRVREAIARIGEHDRQLGEHLAWAVRTGVTCSYRKTSA